MQTQMNYCDWRNKARQWIEANPDTLTPAMHEGHLRHDMIHMIFGLSIKEETLAMWIEYAVFPQHDGHLQYNPDHLDKVGFVNLVKEKWAPTDEFTDERAGEVWDALVKVWPIQWV